MSDFSFTCTDDEAGQRIDRVVADRLPGVPRSRLIARLEHLRCNGAAVKRAYRVRAGDHVAGTLAAPPPTEVTGEAIPLVVLAETPEYVVIDKPQGMVVHPGAGNWSGTLVHALVGRYGETPFIDSAGDSARPGIVHRLDKDTSGVIIVARTARTHAWLVEQFAQRRARKEYLAVVKGVPRMRSGVIDAAIGREPHHRVRFAVRGTARVTADGANDDGPEVPPGARRAVTRFIVLADYGGAYSLVRLFPHTGRTHQLRVHMQYLGHPILGDPLYARRDARIPDASLMLHAHKLTIAPTDRSEPHTFVAPPRRFKAILQRLGDRPDRMD